MKLNKTVLAVAISAVILSACSEDDKDLGLVDGTQIAASGINDASVRGLNNGSGLSGSELDGSGMYPNAAIGPEFSDPHNPLSKSTIYFMLDSSQVQDDFVPVIAAHAHYLVSHPYQRVVMEGHADERGSREYNIALGEQRAKSVASMLRVQGVADNQLDIVSYGEEKPAAFGHDEASWELNRRVEFVYQGK
ncbi:MAG: peptidoglycan-associated lipoprotein Pal [Methylobacter sp.]|nr:peptidoglycan-associated lipoprotein Pal [Methylobacter sp.]MDP2099390.1 peptidoglycan-associated lipoprotein Pal [Methylobacter sp.]MDP2427712.1 peptidoglycan-associated lipoprotein Pal [Methylobacter sp.]MDP3054905.1 peptidoglycan-associated lipoprotein Pal [Methylobacter sp.]MDP3364125.1 peptidoglycan-associated lipoprotein Pal [Methylobacter sp.]